MGRAMWQCRMCSENPFAALFGLPQQKDREHERRTERRNGAPNADPAKKPAAPSTRSNEPFQPRTEEEVRAIVRQWEQYAHPRARDFFSTPEMLAQVLEQLARGTDKHDDPIMGPDDKCVPWYGEITREDNQAVIRMVKPNETAESVTYVSRVLAFLFAADESFEQLMELPKEPFRMSCGNQLCVHLGHISLST